MKAVVMCGGIGSRLKPITETVPKPLVKLLNRCVIDVIIDKLIDAGINEIYLSLGFMATEIIEHCERSKYPIQINYCNEINPLGTAGGVKNCINKTEEDIIVLSGDNVFDFDISDIFAYHYSSDADITLCATEVRDPREYGIVITDDDDSIRAFIEKPTWEQAEGRLVNTGIYVIKGEILDMIPENVFYDFSENLFPVVFSQNKRFMCYRSEGYWGDMGQFESYRRITQDILNGIYKSSGFDICVEDISISESSLICAPACFGSELTVEKNVLIKNNCVLGNNCFIGEGSILNGVIIGDNCVIGKNCELNNCIVCDNVEIKDNCHIEENAVVGYGAKIGRFSRILKNIRIWPGRRVSSEAVVSDDLFYDTSKSAEFDIFGFSGIINSQISINDVTKLGQAIASVKSINKIGFGCDESLGAEIYKNVCISGARICGGICYDFGEMTKLQSYFYSSYCSLDMFVFISTDGDNIAFSFFGKYGMPLEYKSARSINNNCRFSSFSYCSVDKLPEIYNMSLFSTVYKSFFRKTANNCNKRIFANIECENKYLKKLLDDLLLKKNDDMGQLQLLINNSGSEFYIVENNKLYSSARVLALLCELELARGNTVIIPEDAPSFLEEHSFEYGGKLIKLYENSQESIIYDNEIFTKNIWCFDPVLMLAKLISVIDETNYSLEDLFECEKDFTVRKNIIELDDEPCNIKNLLERSCKKKKAEDVYYSIDCRSGSVRLRQLGNANKIRMLVEAADMESARELSDFAIQKIKSANIDNKDQK